MQKIQTFETLEKLSRQKFIKNGTVRDGLKDSSIRQLFKDGQQEYDSKELSVAGSITSSNAKKFAPYVDGVYNTSPSASFIKSESKTFDLVSLGQRGLLSKKG